MSTLGLALINRIRQLLQAVCVFVILVPFTLAALSPLQSGREIEYVAGALAGVLALSLLFIQPLLAAGLLSDISLARARWWHRRVGVALVVAVAVHIAGLFLASPADMSDALLLVAPTPFSLYGVVALWALVLTVLSALVRYRRGTRVSLWNALHTTLTLVVVGASIVHAWMIEGTMNGLSKTVLCILVVLASLGTLVYLKSVTAVSTRG